MEKIEILELILESLSNGQAIIKDGLLGLEDEWASGW